MVATLFAWTAALAATASAFDCTGPYFTMYNRKGFGMSVQRLDPAVEPGMQSSHLHNFDGGNGLSLNTDFEGLTGSSCTTARVKPDKSLYWRPALFWNGNGTGFYRVPEQLKIYYKFGDGDESAVPSEFPENFQMMAGDPFKRSDDGNNPGGIRWACHGPMGASTKENIFTKGGFPTGITGCDGLGLAAEITFPSCWSGKEIDPKNPNAHMAYPNAYSGKKGVDVCPEGFKAARFPTIFVEFWYDITAFNGQFKATDNPWVLAQGDPTGFGFHADFRNGWEKGVLAKATGKSGYCDCGCGCNEDSLRKCFGADQVNDNNDAAFTQCSAKPAFPGEDAPRVDKLPGCNPIQQGPGRAERKTGPDCTSSPPAGGNDESEDSPSSSAAPSASSSAPAASGSSSQAASTSKAAAPSNKPSSTRKGRMSIQTQNAGNNPTSVQKDEMSIQTQNAGNEAQPPVVSAKPDSNGNVVVVTETIYATSTLGYKHRRHTHARRHHLR
ncbi:unnamed protein product [Periconia digitata]|uniref:DUF1996 domain-containing protein n=1 Tax=Periconia digitata TaxID=1303443 RepID=A0A9W4U598_9PLEO|nr:unnamed protein product [Periconia digitata]